MCDSRYMRCQLAEAKKADLEISILQTELAEPKYTKDEMVRWISQFKIERCFVKNEEIIDFCSSNPFTTYIMQSWGQNVWSISKFQNQTA